MKSFQRRERRGRLEIFFAILSAVEAESKISDIVRPTRIQFQSGLSYDTFMKYLDQMIGKKLIRSSKNLIISEKGEQFLKDYERIRTFTEKMGFDYL